MQETVKNTEDKSSLTASLEKLVTRAKKLEEMQKLGILLEQTRRAEKNYIIRKDEQYVTEHRNKLDEANAIIKDLKSKATDPKNIEECEIALKSLTTYQDDFKTFVACTVKQQSLKYKLGEIGTCLYKSCRYDSSRPG